MPGLGIWANLALGIVQLLNLVMGRINQEDWVNKGFLEAFAQYQSLVNTRVASMQKINAENQIKSDDELIKELTE